MKQLLVSVVAAGALAVSAAGVLNAGCGNCEGHKDKKCSVEKKECKPQANCPVMGGKINKDIYVDHKGKRVYFCCKGCVSKFKKNPEKYIKKLEEKGVKLCKVCKCGNLKGSAKCKEKCNK